MCDEPRDRGHVSPRPGSRPQCGNNRQVRVRQQAQHGAGRIQRDLAAQFLRPSCQSVWPCARPALRRARTHPPPLPHDAPDERDNKEHRRVLVGQREPRKEGPPRDLAARRGRAHALHCLQHDRRAQRVVQGEHLAPDRVQPDDRRERETRLRPRSAPVIDLQAVPAPAHVACIQTHPRQQRRGKRETRPLWAKKHHRPKHEARRDCVEHARR